jgi:hypothetical protein
VSLSDRYNRGDGRLQTIDRYLTHIGDRIGNAWWARTGVSRVTFTQALYVVSAWAATQHFAVSHDPIVTVIIVAAVLSWQGFGQSRGGLIEQIQSEASGLPKNTLAALRLIILTLGCAQIAVAFGDVLGTLGGGTLITTRTLEAFLLGTALVALQGGDYIRRTNPLTPSGGHRQSL